MTQYHKDSRAPEIMRLFRKGMRRTVIAEQIGCSVHNVRQTIERHSRRSHKMVIEGLPDTHCDWLMDEGDKLGVSLPTLARAMLFDAIEDAMAVAPSSCAEDAA